MNQSAAATVPWVSEGCFEDIDAQAAQYHGYDQQYQQLSAGRFEGRFRSYNLGALIINLEMANRELAASAATPSGRFGACFLANSSPPCALNATEFSQAHVVLSPAKRCVEGRMAEGVRIYCMDISEELLPDDSFGRLITGVRHDPARSAHLRDLVQTALATFHSLSSPLEYPAAIRSFSSSIADVLWQMSARPGNDAEIPNRHGGSERAVRVFRRARDYIHHQLEDGISIVALCKHLGVSRRSLESAFHSVIGSGPGSYVRLLQLNRIRRDLTSSGCSNLSIGAIAARHGVWHWSRFSQYYRQMYGELPSQTRAHLHQS